MSTFVERLRRTSSVAWLLAVREWRMEYRQSRLSVLWPLLHPLAYTGLLVALRSLLGGPAAEPARFAVYIFIGFCLWQTWFETFRAQMDAIRRSKALITRGELGTPALCLATTYAGAIQLVPRLIVMLVAAIAICRADGLAIVGLVGFSVLILLNAAVLGALVQPFAALSSDISKFVQSISLGLVLTGAVFLPVPTDPAPVVELLMALNPMGSLLNAARAPVLGEPVHVPMAAAIWIGITAVVGMAIPRIGRRTLPLVIERMGG